MKSKAFKKTLSVFLSLLMVLGMFSVLGALAFAAVNGTTLIGRYFSTDNVWYDAARGQNGIQWQVGDYPAYNANLGMTYFNGMYVRIDNNSLFSEVTRDTGLTFAFNYRPNFTGDHRHIISIGQNAYGNGTENQFFISGATSWYSDGKFPVVAWMNGGSEVIKAYPDGVSPVLGHDYNIVVVIDKDAGVVFYIDGEKKNTVYAGSDLNGQIGNVRGFLDAVRNYGENYIGCSRWTADAKIEGYLSDVRIYKNAATETEAYSLIADMAGTAFNLEKPGFNATAYHYEDPATGAYANLAYSSPATNQDSGMGIRGADNSDNYKDIYAVYFKFFTPLSVVMVYDGAHETYASLELETKRHDKANVQDQRIYYVVSNSFLLKTRHNWYGYLDSAWKTWAGDHTENQINTDTNLDVYVGSTNDTPRFWWNALKYTGTGNMDTYYDHEQNVSFTLQAFYDYTIGTTSKGTGTITTLSNYYVLNYKPVYDILDAAKAKYNNEMSGKAWMYTEASYAKAILAMRRLALCNPNLYDYGNRGVDAASVMCAAAIKQAKADYDAINLVKKTSAVTVTPGEGTTISGVSTQTYTYGETFTVTATADSAHDQTTPVITVTNDAGTVVASGEGPLTITVDSPTFTVTTADLPLNRYTLTVTEGEGTGIAYTADKAPDDSGKYEHGTVITATASALTGYDQHAPAISVTGGSETSVSGASCSVKMTGDVTISTAALAKNKYTVTVTPGTGTTITGASTGEYEYGAELTVSAAAAEGYDQSSPKLYVDGSKVTSPHTFTVTAPATVTTDPLTLNTYTVTFIYGDNQTSTVTKTHGATLTTADIPTDTAKASTESTDYTFTGWDGDTAAPITAATVFTAQYSESARKYTVTVTPGTGTTITGATTGEYEYGTELTVTAAANTGYTQSTPVLSVTGETVTGTSHTFTVTGPVTVSTGNLAPNEYTVTFNYGDNQTSTVTKTHGATLTTADIPTDTAKASTESTDYTFTGWDGDTAAPITADTVFTAQYSESAREYTVTFYAEGGTDVLITKADYHYGDPLMVPTAPVKATAQYTYTFLGWSDGETIYAPADLPAVTANASYTAVYDNENPVANTFTVRFFDLDNNQIGEAQSIAYGGAAVAPDLPTKEDDETNHYSVAWDTAFDNITAATDVHAVLTATPHTWDYAHASYHWTGYTVCAATVPCTGCEITKTFNATSITSSTSELWDCTHEGVKTYTAHFEIDVLTDTATENLGLGAHAYGDWTVILLPTTTAKGIAQRVCGNDPAHKEEKEIAMIGVGDVTVNPAPTETENGRLTLDLKDEETGDVLFDDYEIVIPAWNETDYEKTGETVGNCSVKGTETWSWKDNATYGTDVTYTKETDYVTDAHIWGEWTVVTAPTTTSEGTAKHVCSRDSSHVETKTLPVITTENITEPTETEDGKIVIDPENHEPADVVIPALNGNEDKYTLTDEVAGNCTEEGHKTYAWNGNTTYGTDVTVTVNTGKVDDDHEWGEWTVVTAPTTTSEGTAKHVCSRDASHVETKTLPVITTENITEPTETEDGKIVIDPENHEPADVVIPALNGNEDQYTLTDEVAGNCTEGGHKTYAWNGNTTYGTDVTVTVNTGKVEDDHDWTGWTKKDDAEHQRSCKREGCGAVETQDHRWDEGSSPEATCLVPGDVTYHCLVCEAEKVESGEYGPHNWGEWTVVTAPTTTSEGTAKRVCSINDEHFETKPLPVITAENITGPTGTEDGKIVIDPVNHEPADVVIPAFEGNEDQYTLTDEAAGNCTEEGHKTYTWNGNATYGTNVTVTVNTGKVDDDHDWGEWTVKTLPTLTAEGVAERVCGRNAAHKETKTLVKLTAEDITVSPAPTETEDGKIVIGEVKDGDGNVIAEGVEIVIPHLNETDYAVIETVAGNCTEHGHKTYAWKGNAAYGTEFIFTVDTGVVPDAHDWSAWTVVTAADFGVPGEESRECARCHKVETRSYEISAVRDREIQFTHTKGTYYIVHLGGTDYYSYTDGKALKWYSGASLTFDVVVTSDFHYKDYVVYMNGRIVEGEGNTYTIPAGEDRVVITVVGVVDPEEPATPSGGGSESGPCKYCGADHGNTIWGRIVAFIHAILWFFKNLFK